MRIGSKGSPDTAAAGLVTHKPSADRLAIIFDQPGARQIHARRTVLAIVAVAGHEVHQAAIQQLAAEVLRASSESAGQALRGQLHGRAGGDPRLRSRSARWRSSALRSGWVITGIMPESDRRSKISWVLRKINRSENSTSK